MGSLNPQESNINSSPTDMPSALDPVEFRRQGHMMVDFIADYYQNIEKYPVLSQVEPGYLRKCLPESAPDNPEPIESIIQDVQNHIVPGLTHWQSPSFFAYFASNVSIAGFLGEMLCTGFNVVGFSWVSSPAVTELESIVMDWLGNLLTLPKSFLFSGNGGGVIHGSTCEAIICTMVAARDQMLWQIGLDNMQKLVVYGSDQTHSALQKACQIVGINPNNFRVIKTTKSTSFALSPESLKLAISSDVEAGLVPLFLCATVGTTATAAVDPLDSLCQVAKYNGIWVHVDAAYAGSACICPEFRHIIDGVEGANSFSLNAHKWLFTALDCCCVWIKDPSTLTSSLSTNPEFLRNKATDSKQVVDYKDWQIALSRRFRAMKLWLVLKSYGAVNIRNFLRSHVKMATLFERLVSTDRRFEVVVPRVFSMVCFRVSPSAAIIISDDEINVENRINELNRKLLEGINASGHAFMTHAVVGGMYVIRCAIGVTLTEEKHIAMAWKLVQEHADAILTKNNIYDQSQNVECVKNM